MDFLSLAFGVKKSPGAEGGKKKSADAQRAQLKQKSEQTLKRDHFTCRFCGFRSTQFQRVVPWPTAGKDLPFVTACTFCEQCLFLDRAGAMGSGLLVWLPEISQIELNHLARAVYVARGKKTATAPSQADDKKVAAKKPAAGKAPDGQAAKAEAAQPEAEDDDLHQDMVAAANRVHAALIARRADAKRRLGSDDPLLLATIMHESLSDDDLKNLNRKLDGVRLLPLEKYLVRGVQGDVNQFPRMIDFWRSAAGPYGKLPVEKWSELLRGAMTGDTPASAASA